MSYETLLVDVRDGVGTLTLNRPEARSALNQTVIRELGDALTRLEADHLPRLGVADPARFLERLHARGLVDRTPRAARPPAAGALVGSRAATRGASPQRHGRAATGWAGPVRIHAGRLLAPVSTRYVHTGTDRLGDLIANLDEVRDTLRTTEYAPLVAGLG